MSILFKEVDRHIDEWMNRCSSIISEEIILIDVKHTTHDSEKPGRPKEKRGKATLWKTANFLAHRTGSSQHRHSMYLFIRQLFGTQTAFSPRSNVIKGCLDSHAKAELRASLTHNVSEGLHCNKGSGPTVTEHFYKKRHLVSSTENCSHHSSKSRWRGEDVLVQLWLQRQQIPEDTRMRHGRNRPSFCHTGSHKG